MSGLGIEFIPDDLIMRCALYIRALHESRAFNFDKIMDHKDTMITALYMGDTRELLRDASKAWRRTKRNESLLTVCAIIMALEFLNADLMGWGSRFPAAQAKARELFQAYSPKDKKRMAAIFAVLDDDHQQVAEYAKGLFDPDKDRRTFMQGD